MDGGSPDRRLTPLSYPRPAARREARLEPGRPRRSVLATNQSEFQFKVRPGA